MTAQQNPFAYPKPITPDSLPDLFAHHAHHFGGWRMEDEGGAGGDAGSGDAGNGGDQGAGGDTYTPPASQADLDRIVGDRLARERAKYGGVTPDQLAELREKATKHDALENELSSATEKAVKEAQTATQTAADEKYRPMLAETAFRVAIGDRKPVAEVDDFIGDLNLSRFLTDDGKVATTKVLARVDQFAPAKTTGRLREDKSQGGGEGKKGSGLTGLTGNELFDRLHPKKTA